MLQVPYDRPVYPPMMYTLDSFPTMVNVTSMALLPGAERLMNSVIVGIANKLSTTCTASNLRMFTYNTLSANSWNNKLFMEACQFTANYIVFCSAQGQANIEQLIEQAVMLICCVVGISNQNFFAMLDQNNQAKLYKNANIYKEYNSQIMMTMNNMQQRPMGGMAMGGMQMPAAGMMNNAMAGMTHPSAVAINYNQQEQSMHTRYGPVSNVDRSAIAAQQVQVPVYAAPVQVQQAANIVNVTNDIGSSPMDRSLHASVYNGNAETPAQAGHRVEVAIREQADKLDKSNEGDVFLSEDNYDTYSLETMLQMIRSDYVCDAVKSVRVHHVSAKVLTPIFSAVPVEDLFALLSKANTFQRVAEIIRQHYNDAEKSANPRCVYSTVSILDRLLTDSLNRFLTSLLSSRTLNITSFVEDIANVPEYIRENLGPDAVDAYNRYHAIAMQSFFREKKEEHPAPSYYQDGEKDFGYFTIRYGISYLTTSLIECGVKAFSESHLALKIGKETTPLLFKMLVDADNMVRKSGAVVHVFTTLDGLTYYVEVPVYDSNTIILVRA